MSSNEKGDSRAVAKKIQTAVQAEVEAALARLNPLPPSQSLPPLPCQHLCPQLHPTRMSKYPGKFTEHLKLTYDKLLSIHPVKQVRKDLITNGVVIELIRLRTVRRLPWRAVIDRIIQLFGTNWPANESTELTMIKTLSSLYKKYQSLVLKKNLGKFQESPFHIPCPQMDTCEYSMSRSNSKQAVKRKPLIRKNMNRPFRR